MSISILGQLCTSQRWRRLDICNRSNTKCTSLNTGWLKLVITSKRFLNGTATFNINSNSKADLSTPQKPKRFYLASALVRRCGHSTPQYCPAVNKIVWVWPVYYSPHRMSYCLMNPQTIWTYMQLNGWKSFSKTTLPVLVLSVTTASF